MNRSKWMTRFGAGMLGVGLTAAALFNSVAPANAQAPSQVSFDQGIITAPAPDLRVQLISSVVSGSNVIVTYQVRNSGSAAAGAFWSRLQVDGVNVGFDFSVGLPVGGTDNIQVLLPNPAGDALHTVSATADVTGAVSELNESNNTLTVMNQKW